MNIRIPSSYERLFEENLEDLNGLGTVLVHKKTGARIALVSSDDDNKVFYIGFRTPPANSTGVAHIIEHSVLCGSKNFPAKDPFVELVKGSLSTFLNAMTYPDRTVYPVASRNEQDFKNLMHVYMDAVLYPNIYDRKEIFLQEGWHYDLQDEEDELQYNGVVYNEMKGAFSSPEQQLFRMIQNSLFPDTAYGVESGGDPDFIPELSFEEFLDFHKTYYHPTNSFLYLYGDMDFEERLQWLDETYLSHFDRLEKDTAIREQGSFEDVKEVESYYSLGEGEELTNNTYLSYNMVVGDALNKEISLAFQILYYVLLAAPGAPVKQALLDAGIGKDIIGSFTDEIYQPIFTVIAKNADETQKDSFVSVIRETLSELVQKGLDEKSLLAAINFYEFRYREADYGPYPKGLMYGLTSLSSWIYDDEKPFLHLNDTTWYAYLKDKIGTGYFEDLIQKYLFGNQHASIVMLRPKVGLNAEKEQDLKNKLAAIKQGLSEEQIRTLVEETRHLAAYQEEPTTKEELEKIPLLTREDISQESTPLFNEELTMEGIKVIHHEVNTNGIAYVRLLFDLNEIPHELIPYMSLLSMVLGVINTEEKSYLELSNEININTGGIVTDVKSFSKKGGTQEYFPVFEVGFKVLYEKMPEAFALVEEILSKTKFDDGKRLLEIMSEMKSRMQMRFNSSGHSVAVDRAMSYYSAHGLFKENTLGISFYKFLEEAIANFVERKDTIIHNFHALMEMIFTKKNLIVSITADEEGRKRFSEHFPGFVSRRKDEAEKKWLDQFDQTKLVPQQLNEGFKAAMQVQYVARAGNYMEAGYEYTGALKVLKVILSYDYLWNHIRVKGGAYGCMCGFSGVDGDAYFTSYRDPNLKETNQIYEKIADFVKNFTADERDITKYIIGTISGVDTPLTPQGIGRRSLSSYFSGITLEDIQREREQILSVTEDSIRELSGIVDAIIKTGNLCVIGNETKVEHNRDMFKEVKTLLK